ncbi:hypothetical protein EDD15DRAFT_1197011 [Pisolithus albus]|nr:hypothetical protein EDD15DRAFT_1197011 [Pisolithus albus]
MPVNTLVFITCLSGQYVSLAAIVWSDGTSDLRRKAITEWNIPGRMESQGWTEKEPPAWLHYHPQCFLCHRGETKEWWNSRHASVWSVVFWTVTGD